MAESPEHRYITEALERTLYGFTDTRLMGVREADRRMFDYGCWVLRDFTRPLVSQVLWRHEEGIYKDLQSLLHEQRSTIKAYFVRDTIRNRSRIDEIISDYSSRDATKNLLVGLRLVFVPPDFDADNEAHQVFINEYLRNAVASDILFSVVFGRLTSHDLRIFAGHNGPFGLKYAILDEITRHGLLHTPTFKARLGYRTEGPIREVIAMLNATGLIRTRGQSVIRVGTFKGRMLLDVSRLLMQLEKTGTPSAEVRLIFRHLGVPDMEVALGRREDGFPLGLLSGLLDHACSCRLQFGRDLLDGFEVGAQLYREFDWRALENNRSLVPWTREDSSILTDPESLFFMEDQ